MSLRALETLARAAANRNDADVKLTLVPDGVKLAVTYSACPERSMIAQISHVFPWSVFEVDSTFVCGEIDSFVVACQEMYRGPEAARTLRDG